MPPLCHSDSGRLVHKSTLRTAQPPRSLATLGMTKSNVSLYRMPRDLPISNGNLMINFDHEYNIRDVYWPHVGQENQTVGDVSFFGVWCDGKFAWIGDPTWIKTLEYDDDSLVTRVVARAPAFDLEMTISDA